MDKRSLEPNTAIVIIITSILVFLIILTYILYRLCMGCVKNEATNRKKARAAPAAANPQIGLTGLPAPNDSAQGDPTGRGRAMAVSNGSPHGPSASGALPVSPAAGQVGQALAVVPEEVPPEVPQVPAIVPEAPLVVPEISKVVPEAPAAPPGSKF